MEGKGVDVFETEDKGLQLFFLDKGTIIKHLNFKCRKSHLHTILNLLHFTLLYMSKCLAKIKCLPFERNCILTWHEIVSTYEKYFISISNSFFAN